MAWYDTPGTTSISGAAFGNPTQAEAGPAGQVAAAREHAAAQIRGQALIAGAHEDQSLRAGPDPAIKGSGTLTHYRPVGGWAGEGGGGGAGPGATKGAALVGGLEPTAYNAGAGAPAPTQVIRGMHQAFATDTGAGQPQEFATPLQAGQASNRYEKGKNLVAIENLPPEAQPGAREAVEGKFGGYRAPGQTLAEIQSLKEGPGKTLALQAEAGAYGEKQKQLSLENRKTELANNQSTLRKQLEEEVGIPDKDGKNLSLPTDPTIQGIHKKMDRLVMQGVSPDEAYKAVAPELHKHFYTPENLYGAIGLMEKQTGRPVPPELRQQLMSGTPEAMETLYPFTRKAAQQPRGVINRIFAPAPAINQPSQPGVNLLQTDIVAP
jgi:hypothetical protein